MGFCLIVINPSFASDTNDSISLTENNNGLDVKEVSSSEITQFIEINDNPSEDSANILKKDNVDNQLNIDNNANNVVHNHTLINDGESHEFKDLIFENCESSQGGAIELRSGRLILNNCIFRNNVARGKDALGGAIFIGKNCYAEINNCQFINNNVIGGYGGAISIHGTAKIVNCQFNENIETISNVKGYGGAIYWDGENGQILTSTFTSNTAKSHGGAIEVTHSASNLKIDNCVFNNNKALENDGGALSWGGNGGIITNSKFIGNTANEEGGAMEAFSSNNVKPFITINNCEFESNIAKKAGGAIFTGITSVTILNSKFNSNVAGTTGGAIYNENILSLTGSTFTSNNANWGGAVYTIGNAQLNQNKMINNKANDCGGAINVYKGVVNINNHEFTSNSAIYGGSIYIGSGQLTVSNSIFQNNYGSTNAGSINIAGGTANSYNCVFTNNRAGKNGGAVYNAGTLTLSGNTFTSNSATHGGAVYNSASTTASGNTFTSNSGTHGGAVYSSGSISLSKNKFTSNSATYAGALYNANGNLRTSDNQYISNHANYGGVDYILKGSVVSTREYYYANKATLSGGAIYVQKGAKLSVTSSIFLKNSAKSYAGINSLGSSSAQNNWWGHKYSSKKAKKLKTKLTNIKITRWLVLKISSSKSKLKPGQKAKITVDLRYNQLNKKVGVSHVKIPVYFTASNGKINNKILSSAVSSVFKKTSSKTSVIYARVLGIKSPILKIKK